MGKQLFATYGIVKKRHETNVASRAVFSFIGLMDSLTRKHFCSGWIVKSAKVRLGGTARGGWSNPFVGETTA
ncbi:hypothetical protein [Filibacter tadaridae]|uniref:hypothetical protein n=1 Tax=Filibacter tadaridae TaxID=2483811 RepID=UPI000F53CB85|nr:hypothetical protein [Filibacter tadaridae]